MIEKQNTKNKRTSRSDKSSELSAVLNTKMYIRFLSYRCNVSHDEPFEEFVSEISSI
jgi:hypothetical protein